MKQIVIATALAFGMVAPVAAQQPESVTRADFQAQSRAQFAAADANHDGVLTKDELTAVLTRTFGSAPPPEVVDGIFGELDANKDGKATAAEVEAHDMARFDQWDTNHDHVLTADEMAAGRAAMDKAAEKPQ